MKHPAAAEDLALIADISADDLAGAAPPERQETLDRAARACRATLRAALQARTSGASSAEDLLAVHAELDRLCRGNRDLLVLLLLRGGMPDAAIPEMWFEVGRAAAEAGQTALAADLGQMLVAAARDTRPEDLPLGVPSPLARGLHLRMLASVFPESRTLAKQAKKAYVRTKCLAPPDVWARFKAPPAPGAAVDAVTASADAAPSQAVAAAAARTPPTPPHAAPRAKAPPPLRPAVPAEGTLSMQELVALLRDAGETKIGGAEITRHAVRARLRHPADAPPEYTDLAALRDPETGRFPSAPTQAIVERVARRARSRRHDASERPGEPSAPESRVGGDD